MKFLRGHENKHWAELLLSNMNEIFMFSEHDMDRAQRYAMITFTMTLSSWKYYANRLLDGKKDLEKDIKTLYPMTNDQEWDEFLAY